MTAGRPPPRPGAATDDRRPASTPGVAVDVAAGNAPALAPGAANEPTPDAQAPATLSARLRAATHDLHRQAERAGPMPALLRGELPLAGYLRLLRQLHALYAALESGLRRPGAPALDPRLAREAALRADIAHLDAALRRTGGGSAEARHAARLTPEAQAYAAHLTALPPPLLAAHAYVRYLGDLSGGRVVARVVARAYGLHGDGLHFYRFDADPAALVSGLRSALDALPAADHAAVVAEAQSAFVRHVQLFEALGPR
jgi:heme oxygenase